MHDSILQEEHIIFFNRLDLYHKSRAPVQIKGLKMACTSGFEGWWSRAHVRAVVGDQKYLGWPGARGTGSARVRRWWTAAAICRFAFRT